MFDLLSAVQLTDVLLLDALITCVTYLLTPRLLCGLNYLRVWIDGSGMSKVVADWHSWTSQGSRYHMYGAMAENACHEISALVLVTRNLKLPQCISVCISVVTL